MRWTSILAIYFLFWVASAFVLLPFGIKTHDELGYEAGRTLFARGVESALAQASQEAIASVYRDS